MEGIFTQITELVGSYLPNLLGAIVILVVGWMAALIISRIVRRILRRTSLDEKLAKLIAGKEKTAATRTEDWIARGVFYLLMLFVLVAFFQTLQLTLITEPVNNLLNQLFEFAPQLLGAGLLILLAWILATLLKLLVTRALETVKLDEKISAQATRITWRTNRSQQITGRGSVLAGFSVVSAGDPEHPETRRPAGTDPGHG